MPAFRGQETLPIHSSGIGSDGQRKEISGVLCTLDAGVYSANFNTPANLIVPDYGPNSPAIFIRCAHKDQSSSITANASTQQSMSNAAAGGIISVIVLGAATAAKVDDEKDEFKYPAVTVQMRKQKN